MATFWQNPFIKDLTAAKDVNKNMSMMPVSWKTPIGQNADQSFIYDTPPAPTPVNQIKPVPITTANTGIPNVGIPGVKWLNTPIAPSASKELPAVTFSPERAAATNAAIKSVQDTQNLAGRIKADDPRVLEMRKYFNFLQDKGMLQLDWAQSNYIKRFKTKFPEYQAVPDVILYGKVILADPKTEEKYGNINKKIASKMDLAEVPDRYKWVWSKVANVAKRAWEDFWNTVTGAVDVVWWAMKIAESGINTFTWMENSFDEPLKYAPAQEAIDRGVKTNALKTVAAGTKTILDVVPATAATQAWFDVMEDIPWLNLVPKAIWWAMGLASEWLAGVTGMKQEDADSIVAILWNLAFAKWGQKWQARINKAYQEWGLKSAVYMTGLQVPQTVIDTALVPLNLWKSIYDTVRWWTKKWQQTGGQTWDYYDVRQEPRGWPQKLIWTWSWETVAPKPSKFEVIEQDVAEKIIARQWKIKPTIRRDIRQKTWLSAEKFALTNNLVWKYVEESLERTESFKQDKVNEKAIAIYDWGTAQKTPAQTAMATALRDHLQESLSEDMAANDPKLVSIIESANNFLASDNPTYTQIDALKSLYDFYNPDNLQWDASWRLVNPAKHQNAAYRRNEVQKMIENEGEKRGVDIAQINKDIRWSHDLAKWLSAAEERMANNNIISLGDTQVAIMGSLLWGDIAGVGILAIKKMLGSESTTSFIANKLYNNAQYDKTNNSSSGNTSGPLDWSGRFAGTNSPGTGVPGEVTKTTTIPVNISKWESLAIWVEQGTSPAKTTQAIIKALDELAPEERAKAIEKSEKIQKIDKAQQTVKEWKTEIDDIATEREIMTAKEKIAKDIKDGKYTREELAMIAEVDKSLTKLIQEVRNMADNTEIWKMPIVGEKWVTKTAPDEPKMNSAIETKPEPQTTQTGASGFKWKTRDEKKAIITEIFDSIAWENGGITYNFKEWSIWGRPLISISPFPTRSKIIPIWEFKKTDVANYIREHIDLLEKKDFSLGGWKDVENGLIYLDVSVTLPKADLPFIKKFAKQLDQKAVFDLEEFKDIPTWGKGLKSTLTEENILQILEDKYNIKYDQTKPTTPVRPTWDTNNDSGGVIGTSWPTWGNSWGGTTASTVKPWKLQSDEIVSKYVNDETFYEKLNDSLRKWDEPQEAIQLSEAIQKLPYNNDKKVFRNLSFNTQKELDSFMNKFINWKETFQDKAFMSASQDVQRARAFTGDYNVMMQIDNGWYQVWSWEYPEVLFDKWSKFTIDKVRKWDDTNIVYLKNIENLSPAKSKKALSSKK